MGLLGQWVADEWKRSESKSKRCTNAICDEQSIQRRLRVRLARNKVKGHL